MKVYKIKIFFFKLFKKALKKSKLRFHSSAKISEVSALIRSVNATTLRVLKSHQTPVQINVNLDPAVPQHGQAGLMSISATNQKLHGPFPAQNMAEKFSVKNQIR